jgi:hypothetical protein
VSRARLQQAWVRSFCVAACDCFRERNLGSQQGSNAVQVAFPYE